jgi:5-methylcytosine-specific restriction enzyme subunit McrC
MAEQRSAGHITAFEHQQLAITSDGSPISLSIAEADLLMLLAETRPGFCERRHRSIRLAQYCGVVNLGHRVLEVLPKVGEQSDARDGRGVLLRLLRAAGTHAGFQFLPAAQQFDRRPLLDMFIAAFMDSVTSLVRGGLLRQYAQREEDLRLVRGRIDLNRQFGVHFNRPDVIANRYDDLTADNSWNRLIKAALRVCRPWIVSGDLHRRWVELIAAFEDVLDVTPVPGDLNRLVFDRQAVRYRPAMEWVRWILSLLSPTLRAGANSAPAFLFDMNVLFERAVANVVRRRVAEINPHLRVRIQATGRHFARLHDGTYRPVYELRPDIVVHDDRSAWVVADTKWKSLETGPNGYLRPNRADIYQMHAYASAFGVDRLMLIYPGDSCYRVPDTAFLLPNAVTKQPLVLVSCIDIETENLSVSAAMEAFLVREPVRPG